MKKRRHKINKSGAKNGDTRQSFANELKVALFRINHLMAPLLQKGQTN